MFRKIIDDLKEFKNIGLKNRNIVILQDYLDGIGAAEDDNLSIGAAPIGLSETMKTFLGMNMEIFKDENGKLCAMEKHESKTNLIQYDDPNELAEYIEYITYLGIYCKLCGYNALIKRPDGEKMLIEGIGECNIAKNKQYTTILCGENSLEIPLEMSLKDLMEWTKAQAKEMTLKDFQKSGLSQFEARKLIAAQYNYVELTKKEIESLALYKGTYYTEVNALLNGNIDLIAQDKRWDVYGKKR